MRITIAHRGLACSTLILGEVWNANVPVSYQDFKKELMRAIETANENEFSDFWDDEELSGWHVEDYAFIICSTQVPGQSRIEGHLESMKCFQKTERTEKNKNAETECILWMATVKDFLKEIERT